MEPAAVYYARYNLQGAHSSGSHRHETQLSTACVSVTTTAALRHHVLGPSLLSDTARVAC
eukprot:16234-Heterococcus_DN1.PRE.3